MGKIKYYVVWKGKKPGIYDSWEACREQVEGFQGARYKSFPTRELAVSAFSQDVRLFFTPPEDPTPSLSVLPPEVNRDSICVDAACKGNPGVLEYRGVDTFSGAELFRQGPFPEGTTNIGEFLAIVHALAYLKQQELAFPVYSDSLTAIKWVKTRDVRTKLPENDKNGKLFDMLRRAVKWLNENRDHNPVCKWDTRRWGEIPADFGRK
ncbi:MAG: ribonuclease H [Bacteroidetes bacterium]|nr:ribonuclease H [Bacteroidota bacterium]